MNNIKNKNPHALFYSLLKKLPNCSKEQLVYDYSGQTHLSILYKTNRPQYNQMLRDMKSIIYHDEEVKMDKIRKRAIAAVMQWMSNECMYEDRKSSERMEIAKSIIVQAAGKKGHKLNSLSDNELRRVMYEFNSKTDTRRRSEEAKKELKAFDKQDCDMPFGAAELIIYDTTRN